VKPNTFHKVSITGISTVIPPKEICIYDEAEFYGNDTKKIDRMRKMVGFHKRRVVDKGVTGADLAIQAAENLLRELKYDRSEIDALVYVTQRPDFRQPATSFYIHHKLQLSQECRVFDVTQGCPGWVYGLWIASQMIESRSCQRILMLVSDTPSVGIRKEDRISAPVFGDGAAATMLEYNANAPASHYVLETHSKDYEAISTPFLGARCTFNLSDNEDLSVFLELLKYRVETESGHTRALMGGYMDGLAVFNFTMTFVPPNIRRLMKDVGRSVEEIDYLCLHQANKQIIQTVGRASGFPDEKVPYFAFENYGNNTMASIPTTICGLLSEAATERTTTLLCSGFGNGLACASCILTLSEAKILRTAEYQKPDDHVSREAFIEYWKQKLKKTNG
jgi:3-oxoacyl-[acyl-carrier-protein] synthase-3